MAEDTDLVGPDVVDAMQRLAREGPPPQIAPTTPTPEHPRAHLPKYPGLMRGLLPHDHPEVRRRRKASREQRERERAREAATAKKLGNPLALFQEGERVRIEGSAKLRHEDERGQVNVDYTGADAVVETDYVGSDGERRVVVRAPDGKLAAPAQRSLRRAGARVSVPAGGGLPRFLVATMNAAFCGSRCKTMQYGGIKHCLDDHEAKGDPEAA